MDNHIREIQCSCGATVSFGQLDAVLCCPICETPVHAPPYDVSIKVDEKDYCGALNVGYAPTYPIAEALAKAAMERNHHAWTYRIHFNGKSINPDGWRP